MQTFAHEMLREIYEQPEAIRRTLDLYLAHDFLKPEVAKLLAAWSIPEGEILIAASGSSRHSGLAAEILLEDLCGLAVDVEYASEYSTRGNDDKQGIRHPSVLVLSQSGETSDTLAALREASLRGQRTLAITNAAGSSMEREADVSMPLAAGRERAIPATKSFTGQLTVLYLLALYEGARLGRLNADELMHHIEAIRALPTAIEEQLDGWRAQMAALANKYNAASTFLYLGRGIHYAIARVGDGDDFGALRFHIPQQLQGLFIAQHGTAEGGIDGGQHDQGHLVADERVGPMFQLSGGVALGVDI